MAREVAMIRTWMASGLMGCCLATAVAQNAQPAQGAAAPQQAQQPSARQAQNGPGETKTRPANAAMETTGEQKFQQNCSRCHNAPQELSPRISGTVVMHMRVRASLSEADAKAILRFLAP
jgi:mono/diheme cytochrome c family protein